uniref:LysM domain-containing protein n=1 Tax=Caenorhabditis tropicalis TaxID=1561998 RepID=A0A1I7V2B2_9PELO
MKPLILLLVLFSSVLSKDYCSKWVTIDPGDTCWKIARDARISEEKLETLNPGVRCDALAVGDKLCVAASPNKPKCIAKYKIKEGDTCFKIWTSQNLTDRQFMEMNEGLNCNGLAVGKEVCVAVESSVLEPTGDHKSSLPMVETTESCYEYHTVREGDTCYQVSVAYGLKMEYLQENYDCDTLQIGDTICVSKNFTCQYRIEIRAGDTCWFLENAFQTNQTEMERANEGVKCDNLPVGRMMCVWSADDKTLPNMTCTDWKVTEEESSCYDLARENSITIDHFKFLNPRTNCGEKVPKDSEICVKSQSTQPCSSIQFVDHSQSCATITQQYQISMGSLMHLNPTFRCDRVEKSEQICVGNGPFRQEKCVSSQRVTPENDDCEKLSKITGLSSRQIEELNPLTSCDKKFEWGSLICTSSLGIDTKSAQQLIVTTLKDVAPELARKFDSYSSNPDEMNENGMNEQLIADLQKPAVNSKLKELYKTDEKIRKILDSQHPLPRKSYCDQIRKTKMREDIKQCFCGEEELLLYCQVLATKVFMESQDNAAAFRSKRGVACSFSTPTTGKDSLQVFKSLYGGCFGGGCSFPIGLVEINVEADICAPIVNFAKDTVIYCEKSENDCSKVENLDVQGLKFLAERKLGGSISLCAIGSKLVKMLSRGGLSLCWEILAADYFGFVGKLDLGSNLKLIALDIEGGVTMKVHGMAFPDMCRHGDLECEDYCRWTEWNNGRAYGYFKIRALKIFGFSGFKLIEETYNEPKRVGCDAGKEAAVVIRNERTCKDQDDRVVQRRCWSGNDMMGWEPLDKEWGFAFQPHIFGRTLFVCEFVDKNGQKLGFDVYGGKSKNHGKSSFYYVVKNDGIYFGTEKYKEDKLMGSWINGCKEEKPEEAKPEPTGIQEPSGTSSVPAAACGKRIVGYYTGWGEREITENQLKKLTHVIFAFVAMYPDGSVKFGSVSEDSGPQAAVKAERRFLDMKRKARAVNSGVLFFLGSSGSTKRKTFIDSVASFIEHHQIDGVDLDWEYPDMNGKDRKNHVALTRELRERFTQMVRTNGRKDPYILTLASAAGEWNLRNGYDLNGILKYADFINVMTYDYYGAWNSKWGAYTGTPAPLYFGMPFYGRYWKNVLDPIDPTDDMWRTAAPSGGVFEGGYVGWRNLEKEGWNKGATSWHEKTKTPYILNSGARMFLGYENEKSLQEKIKYATDRNLGGLMIWALDLDDDADTLLNLVSSAGLCSGGSGDKVTYTCIPIDDVRWWTPENSDEKKQGQCGKSAPLINGFYPVCDPDDPGFSCCGAAGYCGSGKEYCDCEGCVDYRKDPMLILKEPIKPSRPIQWYTQDAPDGKRGRCGKDVPQINKNMAICNPDDDTKHCCSNGGYCGVGKEYCSCDGCVDYRKTF